MNADRAVALIPAEHATEVDAAELLAEGSMSIKDAARFSGLSRAELYKLMGAGRLAFVKHGKRRLIPRKALVRCLGEGLQGGSATLWAYGR